MRRFAYVFAGLVTLVPALAVAQEDVAAASAAFAEAQKAQLRGDYSRAAELFELADQSAASPAALRSAIRNRETAGQEVRAATLALRALQRYGSDRETRELAQATLDRLSPKLVRVHASCSEACRLMVDGGLVSGQAVTSQDFFVGPGAHAVEAQWPNRASASRNIEPAAGTTLELAFEPPPAAPATAPEKPATPSNDPRPAPSETASGPATSPSGRATLDSKPDTGGGLSPAVFWVGTGLTVVAGGLLTWSGLDTLDARDAYEKDPSRSGYDEGVKLERRTNIFAGVTAGLGVTTILIGLFATDWDGDGEASAQVSPSAALFSYRGPLP